MAANLKTRGRGLLAQQREARAWYWRVRGLSWHQTAAQLADEGLGKGTDGRTPLSRGAVKQMIERVRTRLVIETQEETDRQIAALNLIIHESFDAWEASKGDQVRTLERTITPDSEPVTPTTEGMPALPATRGIGRTESLKETVVGPGDVRYLEQVRKALADIRSIMGIKAPEKLDVTSKGEPVRVISYIVTPPRMPDDAIEADAIEAGARPGVPALALGHTQDRGEI